MSQEENNNVDDMDFSDVAESLEEDMTSAQQAALSEEGEDSQQVEDETQDSSPEDTTQAVATEEDNTPYNPGNVELTRQEHESEAMFEARKDIARFKQAEMSTDDKDLKKEYRRLRSEKRNELAELGRQNKQSEPYQITNDNSEQQPKEPDFDSMSDEEYNDYVFKQMMAKHGLMTKEEFEAQQQKQYEQEIAQAEDKLINNFVSQHPEYKDGKLLDGLINYVNEFYNLEGKTPKQLEYILEKGHMEYAGVDFSASISGAQRANSVIDQMNFNNSSATSSRQSNVSADDQKVLNKYNFNLDDIDVDSLI